MQQNYHASTLRQADNPVSKGGLADAIQQHAGGAAAHLRGRGIEAGVIYSNPAMAPKRTRVRQKELHLPRRNQFQKLIAEMRAGRSRDSRNCADLACGLAFTGCRISEANRIWRWELVFEAGEVVVRGDPETGTKTGRSGACP